MPGRGDFVRNRGRRLANFVLNETRQFKAQLNEF